VRDAEQMPPSMRSIDVIRGAQWGYGNFTHRIASHEENIFCLRHGRNGCWSARRHARKRTAGRHSSEPQLRSPSYGASRGPYDDFGNCETVTKRAIITSISVKHRGLVDFNALKGSTLNHQNTSKKAIS
jgi:hypothetical protein